MAWPLASSLGRWHPQVGAAPPSATGAQLQTASSSAAYDAYLIGRGSDVPAVSDLHAFKALPRTSIEPRNHLEVPGGGYRHSDPGGYSPARQVRQFSPLPRVHHSSNPARDHLHLSADRGFVPFSDAPQSARPHRDARATPSATSRPQSGSPSRATSPDRVQVRLDAMYAEERRVDAILQAKQRDLQALHDQMRAEEDRARREYELHQRDRDALQAEADRLDNEHRARGLFIHYFDSF